MNSIRLIRRENWKFMTICFFLCLFLQSMHSPLISYQGTSELIHTPTAMMADANNVEFGFGVQMGTDEDQFEAESLFFLKAMLGKDIQVAVKKNGDIPLLDIHAKLFETDFSEIAYKLAAGYKNLGMTSGEEYPVAYYGEFIANSFSLEDKDINLHIGLGKLLATKEYSPFFGIDVELSGSKVMAGWDGVGINLGGLYKLSDSKKIYVAFTPSPKEVSGMNSHLFEIGLVLNDTLAQKSPIDLKRFAETLKAFKASDLSSDVSKSSKSKSNSKKRTSKKKSSKKRGNGVVGDDIGNSLMEKALKHIQMGSDYYYEGEFIPALKEYNKVIKILPDYSTGYIRLGTILYQLDKKDLAKKYWRKALQLDPDNKEIKTFLQSN
ncbi:tetratricopeptide repeat protein [bacterium]|jgi:tetratricopeptide (TPR) repeat protein|nr:tetratricopeptide repeat protein [bacterium]